MEPLDVVDGRISCPQCGTQADLKTFVRGMPDVWECPSCHHQWPQVKTFEQELESLINRHSKENGSNTPDFILAQYLLGCLKIWNESVTRREEWYGRLESEINNSPKELFMEKTLHNADVSGAQQNVLDLKVVGNSDMFQLLCKASSQAEGWMKSTKAMEIPGIGCVVQVTTHQRNHDGTNAVAEALTFVPGVRIADDTNGGRKLVL